MLEIADSTSSNLVTVEFFASYIGKTPKAVRQMVQAGKLPVIRMKNPENPSGEGEIYIHKAEWDAFAEHLAATADPDWHAWKDRLFTTSKPKKSKPIASACTKSSKARK
ncbi:Cox family DNA-binding protein [Limnobaculum xujianqingii]|uniref:Cox family DNA-binding protein n=1 Tax=Limnobaculum xujianqingii TaxID=2738837 RepID=UPI00112AB5CE|nr:Cox family DNA-binding protein [Limnobaculum xujianqingii]